MATPALVPVFEVDEGSLHPLGATIPQNGVNFPLLSGSATGVALLLFDKHDSPQPLQIIPLIASKNKTFHFWHVFVKNLKARAHYAFRMPRPRQNRLRMRVRDNGCGIDPHALGAGREGHWGLGACAREPRKLARYSESIVARLLGPRSIPSVMLRSNSRLRALGKRERW